MSDEITDDEIAMTYDFSGAVRGKHYRNVREGYKIRILNEDGSVEEREVRRSEGAVFIDPDLRADFPDSESVNRALRAYRAAS